MAAGLKAIITALEIHRWENKSAPKQKLKDNSEIFTLDSYYTQNRQYSNEAYEADEKDVEYSLDVIK